MSLIFKLYYNPTVIGTENIPSDGPVILCGNHLNELDSKLISSVVNRSVYWSNSDSQINDYLNNNCVVGFFPEKVINIYRLVQLKIMALEKKILEINNNLDIRSNDRLNHVYGLKKQIEKEINNLELAKERLLEMGIDVVDNDILLPFDKKAIQYANETNALLVPFAINGLYVRNNKNLKVRFGSPICANDDINETNNLLRESVKKLEYKNL